MMTEYQVYFDACIGNDEYKTGTVIQASSSLEAEKIVANYARCVKVTAIINCETFQRRLKK